MDVRFWGTRGSIAKPGPATIRYGGNTSCTEVRTKSGELIVIDCGTGAHALGVALMAQGVRRGHLLIGHTHWDHIQGFPFFAPLFAAGNEWDIYGPKGLGASMRQALSGQMESTYFPISIEHFAATTRYHDLVEGSFEIGDVTVRARYLNHPALTLAYRLETAEATLVYACDHEPFARSAANGKHALAGRDARHAAFAIGADLLIHDAQYTASEYPEKITWGHSTVEYAVRVAIDSGARTLALTHHDPARTDESIDTLLAGARELARAYAPELHVVAATEGDVHALARHHAQRLDNARLSHNGVVEEDAIPDDALAEQRVLFTAASDRVPPALREAAQALGLEIVYAADRAMLEPAFATNSPSIAVVVADEDDHDALEVVSTIRAIPAAGEIPVLVVANYEDSRGSDSGVNDWITRPFSQVYVQAKLQAWILRGMSRWKKADVPSDEERRLRVLHGIDLLDTPPDPRYDRITRLAARAFDVPIATVTLVDRDRQWFKSCVGVDIRETPREVAFCAHVVSLKETIVVRDTLLDDRFADNPVVVDEPRIRFYVGVPIVLKDGTILGTVCLMDIRPREFSASDLRQLEDLRDLAVEEIEGESIRSSTDAVSLTAP